MWVIYSMIFTLNRVETVGTFGNYELTMSAKYVYVCGLK